MAIRKLDLKPGINVQLTPTAADGTWSDSQYVRWKDGLLEKWGGWQKITPTPFQPFVRGLHAWADLFDNEWLAAGSQGRLQVLGGGVVYDITPIRATSDVTPNFSTVINTSIVTIVAADSNVSPGDWFNLPIPVAVTGTGLVLLGPYEVVAEIDSDTFTIDAGTNATATVNNVGAVPAFTTTNTSTTVNVKLDAHGYIVDDIFSVQISTTGGGITITGDYLVQTVVDANNFTITAIQQATSSVTFSENGGNAEFQFYIGAGLASAQLVSGYGAGGYGTGPYGGPNTGTTYLALRQWSMDNYGQNWIGAPINSLVAGDVPSGGVIYTWAPPGAATLNGGVASAQVNPAEALDNAPLQNTWILTVMPAQQIFSTGAEAAGIHDNLLVRWCDSGAPTVWTATISNQAGSFRLSTGSRIVGSLQASQQVMIWTDLGLWVAQYIGSPLIWSFNEIARGCGLIAARARIILNSKVVWMTLNSFMIYDGQGVHELPCTVWDYIFRNLDITQADKIRIGADSGFNEIICFFPSLTGNGENDSYVKCQIDSGLWDKGTIIRTDWIDQSVWGQPIGIDGTGDAQQHNTGNDADGSVMDSFAQSGFIDVTDGTFYWRIDQIIPDFILTSGAVVQITLAIQDYPNGPIRYRGPFPVTSTTQYITVQGGRGRQIAFRIESSDLGSFWRIGAVRYRGAPDGRIG